MLPNIKTLNDAAQYRQEMYSLLDVSCANIVCDDCIFKLQSGCARVKIASLLKYNYHSTIRNIDDYSLVYYTMLAITDNVCQVYGQCEKCVLDASRDCIRIKIRRILKLCGELHENH